MFTVCSSKREILYNINDIKGIMVKRDIFPLLYHYKDLIYLDNAATSQKPSTVINAMLDFYTMLNAPIYRSIYPLAEHATQAFEDARKVIAKFIQAQEDEIVFVSNATAGINFIVDTWGQAHIKKGDEIVLTELEHHANLLPWQRLAHQKGAVLKFIPIDHEGRLRYDQLDAIITKKTKIVSFLDVSNAIGVHVDVKKIVDRAQSVGARILIDACQSVPHQTVSVKNYDCDFLVFSGHKMCGPTGIGVLYIKRSLQAEVQPYQLGGGMVFHASFQESRYLDAPRGYEAGTPPIAQAIALAHACRFLEPFMQKNALLKHTTQLVRKTINSLKNVPHIRLIGPIAELEQSSSLVSFIHEKHHAHDVGAYLGAQKICVRTGHYCAQPLAQKLGIDTSIRVSFYLYNTQQDVDQLIQVLSRL